MSLSSEFKQSLKTIESEEILDLLIFRPVAFAFVKLIYGTNITPNQISIVSMLFGIFSGVFYGFATAESFIIAVSFFFISNVLDCMDGQLARLKNNGTKIGRLIDGFIDYVTSTSIFLGIGIALTSITGDALFSWALTIAGGVSKALQNLYFDHYRNMYLEYVHNKVSSVTDEILEFTEEKKKLERVKGKFIERLLINTYLGYCNLQKTSTQHRSINISPEEYRRRNKFLLRVWSWIGSTTHMFVLGVITIYAVFTNLVNIQIYLILTVTFGNLIFITLLIWQKVVIDKLSKEIILQK
jgi:hypothetical protein